MKKCLIGIIVLLVASCFTSNAQEEATKKVSNSKLNLNVEFSNRHIWRGQLSYDEECIKPTIEYNKGNFTIGAWGLYTINSLDEEIDLYIGYKIGNLSLMAYDFYLRPNNGKNNSFFDYSKQADIHMLDFTATYKIADEFPLSIMAAATWSESESKYSYIPGETVSVDDGKSALGKLDVVSTYVELSYPSKIGNTGIKYVLGMAPGNSRHARYFDAQGRKHYSDGLMYVTNIGLNVSHNITITDKYSLPISAGLTFNPHQEKMFLQFNITLSN